MKRKKTFIRPVVLQLRATKQEERIIRDCAAASQLTVSEYLRGAALLMARWQSKDLHGKHPPSQLLMDFASMMDGAVKKAS